MSNFQSGTYLSPGRKTHSSSQTSSKCSSPQTFAHQRKLQQKGDRLSPTVNKHKRSPAKKADGPSKPQQDHQLRNLLNPAEKRFSGSPAKTKDEAKKNKSLKEERQKVESISAKHMPHDNRVENLIRRSDHMVKPESIDDNVPFKQKSHSVKSVSIPHELLTSSQAFDMNFGALLNKKVQTTKNASLKEMDIKKMHSMDLLAMYNKYAEEQRIEGGSQAYGNKFFSEVGSKVDGDLFKKVQNQGDAVDHIAIWPDSKLTQKGEMQKYLQSLETYSTPQASSKPNQKNLTVAWAENDRRSGQKESTHFTDKKSKSITKRKPSAPEISITPKELSETKKKLITKISPRPLDPTTISTQFYSQSASSLKSKAQENRGNPKYHVEMNKVNSHKPSKASSDLKHDNNWMSLPKASGKEQKGSGKFFKANENHLRTGSNQPGKRQTGLQMIDEDEDGFQVRPNTAKHSNAHLQPDADDYMHLLINGKVKRASDSQLRDHHLALQAEKENYALSTRSALDRHENRLNVNSQTEGNELNTAPESSKQQYQSLKHNEDSNRMGLRNEERDKEDAAADQIVSDLLKGSNLKDLKINPNAKFLLLRKQIQEKRNKLTFKSLDWHTSEQLMEKQLNSGQASPVREASAGTNKEKSSARGDEVVIKSENKNLSQEQLAVVFHKTKKLLERHENREKDWEKERSMFINEIRRLRELVKKSWNM